MSDSTPFPNLLRRIRAGDADAAAELVRLYEPVIRCEARLHMTDPRLARLFDSMDICQSVLASFFVRAAAGQFDLDQPNDLIRLLVRMAQNKVASQARRQRARAPDRERAAVKDLDQVRAAEPTPSRLAAGRDLLTEVQRRLTAEERQIADLRGQGQAWPAVAAVLGGTPEARRKQLTRALDRVAQELGFDEDGDATP
jgi:RNA polymerase sigma-70 factor (ECF subfamily)